MRYLLAIDDTDQKDWPGSGFLLEKIRNNIFKNGWGVTNNITRHQLFVHHSIPYTSHNSAMCFDGEIPQRRIIDDIIDLAIHYLNKDSAPTSDPGLCVVLLDEIKHPERLISFGKKAKIEKLCKNDAYQLANQLSIHLSEHGGTGDGVIGALAGTGLRLSGNDGRFRGKHFVLNQIIQYKVDTLCNHWKIDQVCTEEGEPLSKEEYVFLIGKIKTVFKNNQSILLVKKDKKNSEEVWKNLTHNEIKLLT